MYKYADWFKINKLKYNLVGFFPKGVYSRAQASWFVTFFWSRWTNVYGKRQ